MTPFREQAATTRTQRQVLAGIVRVVAAIGAVILGFRLYVALHAHLGYGYLSPNPDLMADLAGTHRDVSWFDVLTKGYYSMATGSFSPGPVYRWALHLGQMLTEAAGVRPSTEAVSRWTAPGLWEHLPGHYLTDYGAARLGMAVMTVGLITAASVTAWRWSRDVVVGVAVFLAPLLSTTVNLIANEGGRYDENFTLPMAVIGPSLIPVSALFAAVAVLVAASGWRRGPAAALLAGGVLMGQHLLALPLSVLAVVWAFIGARRATRDAPWWATVRHLSWGWAPFVLMAARFAVEGPRSFLPYYQATGIDFSEGWRGLGLRLHLPPVAALLVWLSAIAVSGYAARRTTGPVRWTWAAAATVLAVALLHQLLFFPSWRHYYSTWVELVLVGYLVIGLALWARRSGGGRALLAVALVAVLWWLPPRLEIEGQGVVDDVARTQRGWDVLGLRDYAEGRRVDVGDDEGLAGMILYMTTEGCVIGAVPIERAYPWGVCGDGAGPDLTMRRWEPLDGVRPLDRIEFLGGGGAERPADGVVYVYTGRPVTAGR